jgi:predicted ATPase
MPKAVTALSVFLASPGDVKKERGIAHKIIDSLDKDLWDKGVSLRTLRWEDTPSGLGDPQSLINQYSESADLVVVIFNRRFGSPTKTYPSGTIEEFERAKAEWERRGTPRVKIFFREMDRETKEKPDSEAKKVMEFRERFWQQRLGLYVDYKSPGDFGSRFRSELYKWVDGVTRHKDAAMGGTDSSLPAPTRPFIGRDAEVNDIRNLLRRSDVRVVTLHGIAGVGKTSLAVQAAAELKWEYGSRLIYVDLSAVTGDHDIIPAIADKLDVRIAKDIPLIESVKENLREQLTLLVLNHVANVQTAAPQLALLSKSAPGLKMLVTSHEPLHIEGEEKCWVKHLPFPAREEMEDLTTKEALKKYPAVVLFYELMRLKDSEFKLLDQNVPAVAEICSQLDGLPLAIRLAVNSIGRLALSSLSKKSSQLKRLRRAMGELEAAFMSSYGELTPAEKKALRRFSVFVHGFTLEAAQAVAGLREKGGDVSDEVESLISKDLLQLKAQAWGSPRLTMLNTIREFAENRLREEESRAERQALRHRHATFYVELAEDAEPRLHSEERESNGWEERLDAESGNLSAALKWSLSEEGDGNVALRLVGALFWLWDLQGSLEQGRRWAEAALERAGTAAEGETLAKALYCLGGLYFMQSDYEAAQGKLGHSVRIWRTLPGRENDLGLALAVLGMTLLQQGKSKHEEARACASESVRIFEGSDDTWGQALSLNDLGNVEKEAENYEAAQRRYEESLAKWQQLNDGWGRSLTLSQMGDLAYRRGDYRTARRLLRDALEIQRRRRDKWGLAWSLNMLGKMDAKYPDYEMAAKRFRESLMLHRELGRKHMMAHSLEGLACVAYAGGQCNRAAILFAASSALRNSIEAPRSSDEEAEYARILQAIRDQLEASFEAASAHGRKMSPEEMVNYAMKAD